MSPELNGVMLDLGKLLGVVLGIAIFFTLWKDLAGVRSTLATTALGYEHVLSVWWYWVLVIILGLIVPFIILLNPKTRNLNSIAITSVLVLIGMFAARVEFTIGGQIVRRLALLNPSVAPPPSTTKSKKYVRKPVPWLEWYYAYRLGLSRL